MELSFEQLKSMVVFAQVVEQGSLSGAARQLGLSRGVVSYHLKKLEQQLGVSLMHRSTRALNLTDAGRQYYQHCHAIAERAQQASQQIDNLKQEPEGLIRITCPVNIGLERIVPALDNFMRRYPKIELDVMLSDEVVNIVQEGIDLAIRGAPLPDSGLQAAHLATLVTGLYASPAYLEQHGVPHSPGELNQHRWVIYKLTGNQIELSQGKRSFRIQVNGLIQTNNAAARTAFVEGGHGIGRLPVYDAQPRLQQGKLVRLLADYQLADIQVYGVYPPGAAQSKKLRLLIDYLKQQLQQ